MTGRELIVYILENHLEDEPVFKDGKFIGCLTIEEAAVKANTGIATTMALLTYNNVDTIKIKKDTTLIPANLDIFKQHD